MYRLDVLGPPRLTGPDGSPADLALGKPFAVLVFLALTDTPPTRKELARLFWPSSEPRNARQSVRQTLSILRRATEADLFESDDPVKLRRGALQTDVEALRLAVEEGDVEAAEALWRGRFMQEFALPDAPEWTRWVETREMALETGLVHLLTADAQVLRQRHDAEGAIGRLEKAIAIDPYREAVHADLVELFLETGQLSKAATAIGRAREMLGPGTESVERMATRLERRLRRQGPEANGGAERAPSTETALLRTELVGRTREMSILLEAWRRAMGTSPAVAVITGRAGVGKTRLTEELADFARGQGAAVVRITGERAERSLQWGSVAELARELRRLSPAIPFDASARAGTLESAAVVGSLAALVSSVAARQPLLVVIDEAQWIDAASRAALSRLARSLDAAHCMLVVCLQDEETDGAGRDFADALERADGALRVPLGALSDGDVREMIAIMVAVPDDDGTEFREQLTAAAAGNPLYLTELLRALVDEGVLVAGEDGLRLATDRLPDPLPLPKSVRELLHRRLGALSDPSVAFVAHLAQMGGKARLAAVRERSDLSEGELARAAGELLAAGIVQWSDPEIVSFPHDRLLRAVLEDFPVGGSEAAGRRWPARLVGAAVVIGVLLSAAFLLNGRLGRRAAEAAPYGGGLILLYASDSTVYEIDPRIGPPSEWRARPTRFWHPSDTERSGPFRLASGDTVWYARSYRPGAPPGVIEVRNDGTRRELIRMDGDVNLPWASPDGRYITYKAQNPEAEEYWTDLFVARTDGSEARRILAYDGTITDPVWSQGGHYISTSVIGEVDTLLVLTPDGTRVAEIAVDRASRPAWCGATDTLVSIVRMGDQRALLVLDVGERRTDVIADADALFPNVACSPDGSALIYDRAVDGRRATVLRELTSGRLDVLPSLGNLHFLDWIPDGGIPVPVRVALDTHRATLAWGTSRTLDHEVVLSDSTGTPGEVTWSSSDPAVASVSSDGRISANFPGRAWIRASLDGWLADSAEIVVPEAQPATLLFQERFQTLDSTVWMPVGQPTPSVVRLEDGPALSLEGDGIFKDGVVSRQAFDVTGGATLEFAFRLNPTVDHHQRLIVSLVSADPIPGEEAAYPAGWSRRVTFGLSYPASEELRFDPTEIHIGSTSGEPQSVFVPGLLPTDAWVNVALQLRPDGILQLYLEHALEGESRLRVVANPDDRFRIEITGAAVGTEVLVRDVRLWEGVRY